MHNATRATIGAATLLALLLAVLAYMVLCPLQPAMHTHRMLHEHTQPVKLYAPIVAAQQFVLLDKDNRPVWRVVLTDDLELDIQPTKVYNEVMHPRMVGARELVVEDTEGETQ